MNKLLIRKKGKRFHKVDFCVRICVILVQKYILHNKEIIERKGIDYRKLPIGESAGQVKHPVNVGF